MNQRELGELRRRFRPEKSAISRVYGCYVNSSREIIAYIDQSLGLMPQEEAEKYLGLLKKALSGTLGRNLIDIVFSTQQVADSEEHRLLSALRTSELKDAEARDAFYQQVIGSLDMGENNYLILLGADAYDVPHRGKDGEVDRDACEEVFRYFVCCVCPVKDGTPELGYFHGENEFHISMEKQIVGQPELGFLFPAFNDRSTDLHSTLYYSKDSDDLHDAFIEQMLGCPLPLPAGYQKESFQTIIEETLGDACDYETVKTIHENLSELIEEHKDEPEPLVLDKYQVRNLLEHSGIEEEQLATFDQNFDETAGEKASIYASNIANTRAFEVKTPDVIIKVNPDHTDLIETREIDGRQCLVIAIDGGVEVNGIAVTPGAAAHEEEE